MKPRLLTVVLLLEFAGALQAQPQDYDLDAAPHHYWRRPPQDRFTRLTNELASGGISLERGSEKAVLASLLQILEIPASSQMLVFSTTSLQLSRISRSNPRAIYFTDDLYLGYVPGGRIEVVSLDPELGAIFHIMDIPGTDRSIRLERSGRCMNCHAGADTGRVPGLVVKSVVPGPNGGSLMSFRQEQTGHSVPFEERFGGWYVTGLGTMTNHWGNLAGELTPQGLTKTSLPPGQLFDWSRYPVATSDLVAQLVHEHQVGFVNRTVEGAYRTRAYLHAGDGKLSSVQQQDLEQLALGLTRYLLFADEAPLPAGGMDGDPAFKADFLRNRRVASGGLSLKDFDLRTRLFRHRCSYQIYSPVFTGLPPEMKQRVYRQLGKALNTSNPDSEYAYLSGDEKRTVRRILRETLTDLPRDW